MSHNLEIKVVETEQELKSAYSLRRTVFVNEQNVPEEIEYDEYDHSALHVICKLGDRVVGTGRVVFFDDGAKIGRVAVLKEYRKQGIGTIITKKLIAISHNNDVENVYANVQLIARGFYAKLGFKEVGDIFYEADIKHVKMVLGIMEK